MDDAIMNMGTVNCEACFLRLSLPQFFQSALSLLKYNLFSNS